jgi:hypothetical protein
MTNATLHKAKYLQEVQSFPDRISTKDRKVYYISLKEKEITREG